MFLDYIDERTINIAKYIIKNKTTVRDAAKVFAISKSTVHKDITERLPKLSKPLTHEVRLILDENLAQRHIRGGEATRKKYVTPALSILSHAKSAPAREK